LLLLLLLLLLLSFVFLFSVLVKGVAASPSSPRLASAVHAAFLATVVLTSGMSEGGGRERRGWDDVQ